MIAVDHTTAFYAADVAEELVALLFIAVILLIIATVIVKTEEGYERPKSSKAQKAEIQLRFKAEENRHLEAMADIEVNRQAEINKWIGV